MYSCQLVLGNFLLGCKFRHNGYKEDELLFSTIYRYSYAPHASFMFCHSTTTYWTFYYTWKGHMQKGRLTHVCAIHTVFEKYYNRPQPWN